MTIDAVGEADGGAVEIGLGHLVDYDFDAAEIADGVAFELALVEVKLVHEPRTSAGLNGNAQAQIVTPFLLEQGLDFGDGVVTEHDVVGHVKRLGHFSSNDNRMCTHQG